MLNGFYILLNYKILSCPAEKQLNSSTIQLQFQTGRLDFQVSMRKRLNFKKQCNDPVIPEKILILHKIEY